MKFNTTLPWFMTQEGIERRHGTFIYEDSDPGGGGGSGDGDSGGDGAGGDGDSGAGGGDGGGSGGDDAGGEGGDSESEMSAEEMYDDLMSKFLADPQDDDPEETDGASYADTMAALEKMGPEGAKASKLMRHLRRQFTKKTQALSQTKTEGDASMDALRDLLSQMAKQQSDGKAKPIDSLDGLDALTDPAGAQKLIDGYVQTLVNRKVQAALAAMTEAREVEIAKRNYAEFVANEAPELAKNEAGEFVNPEFVEKVKALLKANDKMSAPQAYRLVKFDMLQEETKTARTEADEVKRLLREAGLRVGGGAKPGDFRPDDDGEDIDTWAEYERGVAAKGSGSQKNA